MANKDLVQPDHIIIGEGTKVFYTVRKSKRAGRVQIRIVNNALELIVPYRERIEDARRFLYLRSGWIMKHIHLLTPKQRTYLIFGEKITIEHTFGLNKYHTFSFSDGVLKISSPAGTSLPVHKLFEVFRKKYAGKYLPWHAAALASKYNFSIGRISVRSQKSRWGSCSSRGTITLNERLIEFKPEVIDYVIIHELCHTVHMNHSKDFWSLVGRYCPDYKEHRRTLKHK